MARWILAGAVVANLTAGQPVVAALLGALWLGCSLAKVHDDDED